jgi:hypothetical protein
MWDTKILRKMYGPVYENDYQRIKSIKSAGIVTVIRVVKMYGKRTVKILERQPGRSESK